MKPIQILAAELVMPFSSELNRCGLGRNNWPSPCLITSPWVWAARGSYPWQPGKVYVRYLCCEAAPFFCGFGSWIPPVPVLLPQVCWFKSFQRILYFFSRKVELSFCSYYFVYIVLNSGRNTGYHVWYMYNIKVIKQSCARAIFFATRQRHHFIVIYSTRPRGIYSCFLYASLPSLVKLRKTRDRLGVEYESDRGGGHIPNVGNSHNIFTASPVK